MEVGHRPSDSVHPQGVRYGARDRLQGRDKAGEDSRARDDVARGGPPGTRGGPWGYQGWSPGY